MDWKVKVEHFSASYVGRPEHDDQRATFLERQQLRTLILPRKSTISDVRVPLKPCIRWF